MPKQFSIADSFTAPDVEQQLLSSIYQNPEVYYQIIDIAPSVTWTYYREDFDQLAEAIVKEDSLPDIEVVESSESPDNLAYHLSDLYRKRMTAYLVEEALEKLHGGTAASHLLGDLERGLIDVQNAIRELQMGRLISVPSLFSDLLEELRERHQAVKEKGVQAVGLPSGIKTLDKLLGGFQEGIHLLAAEPGQGKSTLALQFGRHVSSEGYPAIFVSFEESLDRLTLKSICAIGGLNIKRYAEGWGNPEELQPAIKDAAMLMKNLYFVQGNKNLTVSNLKAKALQLMQKTGKDKCLIIVDYLQRWASFKRDNGFTDFRHTVRELVGELRELSLRLKSPCLIISSQNRTGQGSSRLTSLKESGDLEYDADSAMFMTRSEDRMGSEEVRMVDLHLEKNRYGDKGKIDLVFKPDVGVLREEEN